MPDEGRKRLLRLLLPGLAATEFLESSSFLFAASHMARGLGVEAGGLAALLTAYTAGCMWMVALQQAITHRFGYRRTLIGALLLFQCGALASLLAPNLPALLVSRWLQGLGGGALFTSARILVVLLFPAAERPLALRRFIGTLFALSACGPALSTLLLQTWGWRAVLLTPMPLAATSLLGVWRLLPDRLGQDVEVATVHWRAVPVLLLPVAMGLLQFGLSEARFLLWIRPAHLLLPVLAGSVLLGWFLVHQRGHAAPLLRWQTLRQPAYLTGLALYAFYYLIANANGFLLPVVAEQVVGLSTGALGLLNSLGAVTSWLAAMAYLRHGARSTRKHWLMAGAAALLALACVALGSAVATRWGLVGLLVAVLAKGVFGALFVLPLAGLTFRGLDDAQFGPGYQAKNLLRHGALSLGTALAATGLVHWQWRPDACGLPAVSVQAVGLASASAGLAMQLAWVSALLVLLVLAQRRLR